MICSKTICCSLAFNTKEYRCDDGSNRDLVSPELAERFALSVKMEKRSFCAKEPTSISKIYQ